MIIEDALIDKIARIIAAKIWRPQPDMSGDIWRRIHGMQKRAAEDAAYAVIKALQDRQGA